MLDMNIQETTINKLTGPGVSLNRPAISVLGTLRSYKWFIVATFPSKYSLFTQKWFITANYGVFIIKIAATVYIRLRSAWVVGINECCVRSLQHTLFGWWRAGSRTNYYSALLYLLSLGNALCIRALSVVSI